MCQGLFFNKVADLRPATLLKKRLWHRCFLWILWNFQEHLFTELLWTTASVLFLLFLAYYWWSIEKILIICWFYCFNFKFQRFIIFFFGKKAATGSALYRKKQGVLRLRFSPDFPYCDRVYGRDMYKQQCI